MQTQLTIKLTPQLDNLTQAINKISKDTGEGISKALDTSIKSITQALRSENLIGKALQGPKLPQETLSHIKAQLAQATRVKLDLDLKEANAKIDSMRYQILGIYGVFKGLFQKPISVAMEFESSMADVKKVVDFESKEELKGFENQIWNLTKTIPLAAKDLTAIVASGGQLGLDKNILIPFTDVVAKMSTAFDMSTAEAGDTIAGLMKKMGIGIESVRDLGDAINYIGAKSAGSPREVVDILGRIGGMAKTIGLTSEQTAGLAGAFANMKIPSEQAGTAINKMLNVLGNAEGGTARFQGALKKIGINAGELKNTMSNNPMEGILKVLKSIEGADKDEKIGILKDMFGEEAAPKIAQITSNMQEFEKILALVSSKDNYSGSMQAEFDEVSKTTANAMQILENSIAQIAKTIGDVFLPPLASMFKVLAKMGNALSGFLQQNQWLTKTIIIAASAIFALKVIMVAAKAATALWAVATYPLKIALFAVRMQTMLAAISTKAYIVVSKGAALATKAWGVASVTFARVFKLSMLSVKAALISTGIGALIVAIGIAIGYVVENWESIAPRLVAVWEWIKEQINPVIEWFSQAFSFVSKGIDKVINGARAVTDFLGITDKEEQSQNYSTKGLSDEVINTQKANTQAFYEQHKTSQINDNKVINITTGANANDVVQAITQNSYAYAD
ncbi:phage tail tape measure protein [Helicobacter jaachi]|nr:phage tail tape measure protein [Helicobacter jaachi]